MKREEVLAKLGFTVPECKKKRVIIVSDIACEADDPFAIMQHLLSPSLEVKGIVACHFEYKARLAEEMVKAHPELLENPPEGEEYSLKEMLASRGSSMEKSYAEGEFLLKLAGIDDVPLLHGASYELNGREVLPESEGADFIIQEALKDDPKPLYVCMLGGETDLAIALLKCPEIAERFTAIGILGARYPKGGWEFNCVQDTEAINAIFESSVEYWQIPQNVYGCTEFSFAELVNGIRPCGEIGKWMVQQMFDLQHKIASADNPWPNAECWSIGDNPTAGVLLQGMNSHNFHMQKAPHINPDCTYQENPEGREIRVYDNINYRLTLHDLMAKMQLCYKD